MPHQYNIQIIQKCDGFSIRRGCRSSSLAKLWKRLCVGILRVCQRQESEILKKSHGFARSVHTTCAGKTIAAAA